MEFDKVIFLDIDGPLATNDCFVNTTIMFGKHIYKWNPKCVEILNEILIETNAELVLSSDWRNFFSKEELDFIFKWNNVVKSPIDITDSDKYRFSSSNDVDRIHQIGRYLKDNKIKNWVSVDDMDLTSNIVTNFVRVESENGISQKGIKEQLILFLNQNT